MVMSIGEHGWRRTRDGWRCDLGDESGCLVLENEGDEHKCDRDNRGDTGSERLCRTTEQAVVGVAVVMSENVQEYSAPHDKRDKYRKAD
jgi:hypothetical protein